MLGKDVSIDNGRKRISVYRPIDGKTPPINSNISKIYPEDVFD